MSHLATCHDCNKSYRVPHRDKKWQCKECGQPLVLAPGEQEATAQSVEQALGGGRECPGCGALDFGGAQFCEECGASFQATGQRKKSEEEKRAAAGILKAKRKINRLGVWLKVGLFFQVIGAIVLLIALPFIDIPPAFKGLLFLLQTAILTLYAWAIVMLERRPFPPLVVLGSLHTLQSILAITGVTGGYGSIFWATIMWYLCIGAARYEQFAKKYPDHFLSKRMRGEHLRGIGGGSVRERQVALRKREAARDRKRMAMISVGIVAALGLGWFASTRLDRAPTEQEMPELQSTLDAFKEHWNAGDPYQLGGLARPASHEKMRTHLNGLSSKYEWGPAFPQLGEATYAAPVDGKARVRFASEGGDLPVLFRVEGGAWVFTSIDFREVKHWRPGP